LRAICAARALKPDEPRQLDDLAAGRVQGEAAAGKGCPEVWVAHHCGVADAVDGAQAVTHPHRMQADLRFLKREPVEIVIECLGIPRRASVGELFRFGPFTRVISLETRGASLEWEIHSMSVDWAVDRLKVTDAPDSPQTHPESR